MPRDEAVCRFIMDSGCEINLGILYKKGMGVDRGRGLINCKMNSPNLRIAPSTFRFVALLSRNRRPHRLLPPPESSSLGTLTEGEGGCPSHQPPGCAGGRGEGWYVRGEGGGGSPE